MKRKAFKLLSYLCILSITFATVSPISLYAAELSESMTTEDVVPEIVDEEVVSEPETLTEEQDEEIQTEITEVLTETEEETAVETETVDMQDASSAEIAEEAVNDSIDEAVEQSQTKPEVEKTEAMVATPTVSGGDAVTENTTFTDTVPSYVDEQGNIFVYTVDEAGNATITGITLSGASLTIPVTVDGISVIAVDNGVNCVVTNPTVKIPDMTINCNAIGVMAFHGVSIGTLTIGEDVKNLSVSNAVDYSHKYHYRQFADAVIDKVVFNATEIVLNNNTGSVTNSHLGPFNGSNISSIEFGSNVMLIPECLFEGAIMKLDTLELQVPRIGGQAFYSSNISIGHLTIGENVECFEEFSNSSDFQHYWEQFTDAKIEKLTLRSAELKYGNSAGKDSTNTFNPPFSYTNIGSLEIDSSVIRIPELFLCKAVMTLDELTLTTPFIGAYAFSGSYINIGTLTFAAEEMRLEELSYSTMLHQYWAQFADSKITKLRLNTTNLELVKSIDYDGSTSVIPAGPFKNASVGTLEIHEAVERIPDYFLADAYMSMDSFTLEVPIVGAKAFASGNISFGTLTISEKVAKFEQSCYSQNIFYRWSQFEANKIGKLVYQVPCLNIGTDYVTPNDPSGINFYGPFYQAKIDAFILGNNVTYIPNYLLYNASAQIEELDLHISNVGARAFASATTTIGKLTLHEDVVLMEKCMGSNLTFNYWMQFGNTTINEVYYYVPSLQLEKEAEYDNENRGPFYETKIGKLHLGEGIERFPAYCFIGAYLQQEELEIHAKTIGTRAFAGKNISIDTLTIGSEVETFESVVEGSLVFFGQFQESAIGTLKYLPVNAKTGTSCYKGVFDETTIGKLEIDEAVEVLPNYLFYESIIDFNEFELNVPTIGYFCFSGRNIVIDNLTVGEKVTTFLANSNNYNRAFTYATIHQLNYNATEANMETLNSVVSGPFSYSTTINGLTIGENVKIIPYGCFRDSTMNVEELTINTTIGYGAFDSSYIKIGTLNIGKDTSYDGMVSNCLASFEYAEIGTLNYNCNSIDSEWSKNSNTMGMFSRAEISQLNIGDDVEVIPAFWFKNATLTQDTLIIPCNFSYQSFYSYSVDVNTLVLTDGITEFNHLNNQNNAFMGNTYDTIRYEVPNAKFTATKFNASGIFNNATITNFIVGEMVEYMDVRLFSSETVENCYVYPVHASDEHNAQTITESVMPKCTSLYIHYNSDFKPYFSRTVSDYHWMCVDYFDTSYGDKIYDEETGEYKVEIFKTCSICGYTEEGTEELDNSYDVYLSIPVEIPLTFHAEDRAYSGSEEVYAYGTLGNAYEGLRVVTNTEAENYGKAVKEDVTYDILSYLSVSFMGSESADFTPEQLTENAAIVTSGSLEGLYQNRMNVSVDALAFIEGGVGFYQISIPIRIELY